MNCRSLWRNLALLVCFTSLAMTLGGCGYGREYRSELSALLSDIDKDGCIASYELGGYLSSVMELKVTAKFEDYTDREKYEFLAAVDSAISDAVIKASVKTDTNLLTSKLVNESKVIIPSETIEGGIEYRFYIKELRFADGTIMKGDFKRTEPVVAVPKPTEPKTTSAFPRVASDDDSAWVWTVAKDGVKNRLKAPSTAKFPWTYDPIVEIESGVFLVKGYVDAENGFGAKIRTNWIAQVEKLGHERYEVVEIQFEE